VAAVRSDYRQAPPAAEMTDADRAMLDFAVKLTYDSRSATKQDIETLHTAGFSDAAIHEIVQVTGFFAYYNRLADGLGIDPEPPEST